MGRLGELLRRLEEASKNEAKNECTKSRQKVRLEGSWGPFLADHVGEPFGTQLTRSRGKPTYQDGEYLRRKLYTEKLLTESEE